jgi:hypothetical protein
MNVDAIGDDAKGLEIEEDAVPKSPKMPGLRWCRGFIALKRCVIEVAPALIPSFASS